MARPVWRNQLQYRSASGIDIMIAFDVSLSMDIDDFIDHGERVRRIDVAKAVVDDFISFSDFAPTFLEVAGLKPLPEMISDGFSGNGSMARVLLISGSRMLR